MAVTLTLSPFICFNLLEWQYKIVFNIGKMQMVLILPLECIKGWTFMEDSY